MKSRILIASFMSALAACGGGSKSPPASTMPPPTYTVSGTVTGLTGTLVLRVNDASDVSVAANGAVTLASGQSNGASYSITVKTQPSNPTQKCALANASGTIAGANITTITVTCAAVPLTLASSTPANGATGVTRDAPLTLTFSTSVDASASTVSLSGPAGEVTSTTQVSGAQLVITPATPLAWLGAYTLSVSGLKGTGGELPSTPITLAFQAADRSWSPPRPLETAPGDAAEPRIAMDANGNALALWLQSDGTQYNVMASHRVAGANWEDAEFVEHQDLGTTQSPEVRFDQDGNALAVWVEWSGSQSAIWANRLVGTGGWGTAGPVEGSKGDAAWPTLDFDANGNGLAAWNKVETGGSAGTIYRLESRRYTVASGWTITGLLSPSSFAFAPQVCSDASGRGHAVWYQVDALSTNIWSNTYTPGTGWLTAAAVETIDAGNAEAPQIVCTPGGNALAAWLRKENGMNHLHAAQLISDSWTAPVTLDDSGIGASAPALASDANGNVIVIWSQSESTGRQLWSRRFATGRGWSTARRLDDPAAGSPTDPTIALNSAGDGVAVWRAAHAGRPGQIWAARVHDGEFSTAQQTDPDTSANASSPRVAIDSAGNAIAVWMKCAAACDVVASRFE